MKLKAEVRQSLGRTKHSIGRIEGGELIEVEEFSAAKWLEIVEEKKMIFLYRYDADGMCVGDTWHASIDDAMAQAAFEFQTMKLDWHEIE